MRDNPPILISGSIEPPKRERVFYVDALRSVASVLVVASHIFAPICAGMNDYSRSDWWVFNLLDSFIRPCAALFVMISGKLLLGSQREEPYLHFVRRRCLKLFIPFFVWSLIYVYVESQMQGTAFSFPHAVLEFFEGPTEYHLWFMYMILTLYLVAPFLRQFVRHARPRDIAYTLGLWMVFLTGQFIFPGRVGFGPAVVVLNYGGFFLLGYALDQFHPFKMELLGWVGAGALLVVVNAWATYLLTKHSGGILNEKFYGGDTPLQALYSGVFFMTFKTLNFERLLRGLSWVKPLITRLSQETYNVYLVHAFFIWVFAKGLFGVTLSADTTTQPIFGVAVTTLAVLACSLTFSIVAKRLPVLSKLLVTGVKN